MISVFKNAARALLLCSLAVPAYAQVCMETGGSASGKINMSCDMSYRNQLVTCDSNKLLPTDPKCTANPPDPQCIVGTRPACPKKPMPMITTPLKSYIQDYNAYLWHYPRDATSTWLPYDGAYSLGTPGDTTRTFQLFDNTAPGTKRLAACTAQIRVPTDPTTLGDWAKLTRLQVDNCTNQYLINAAMYPVQKASTKLLSMDDPTHPSAPLNIQGECQPLKTFTENQDEYKADHYLNVAWQKTMTDPSYRASTPAALKCVPCTTATGDACDHEPHLPCQAPQSQGTTLDNPINPPSPFPEVRLSSIATVPYENINDPTHPFSPRWDFLLSDRDYANLNSAQIALVSPQGAAISTLMGVYMSKKTDDVYCAGVRNADNESDATKKADATVPVDILSFRANEFNTALTSRTSYNSACYKNTGQVNYPESTPFTIPQFAIMVADSWCWRIDNFTPYPPTIYAHNKPCWECFGLNGKVDDISQQPPCTTRYDGHDLTITGGMLGGGLNFGKLQASCLNAANMKNVCTDMRKPYTSLNVLKMRYQRTNDPSDTSGNNNVLKNGTGEGMTFKEYFGNHMPYPRMWDMGGVSLQNSHTTDMNNQPPTDTTGQYTAIVGIGREAAPGAVTTTHPDERCLTGGWATPTAPGATAPTTPPTVTFGGVSLTVPDAMTSWTEMKLYETRTLRQIGMSCIGRYEKVFKPGNAENMMLLHAGGRWDQLLIKKCDLAKGLTQNCSDMTLKDFIAAGSPANTATTVYIKSMNAQAYPQPWRGYLGATTTTNQFPNWPDVTPSTTAGLDNATPGDIILLPNGPKDDASTGMRGLPKLAFVIETHLAANSTCASTNDCYVRVLEPDDGKWPDSCGTTNTWGEMKARYYYKTGMLPAPAKAEYTNIGSLSDCMETQISQCEMSAWSTLKVYHISTDTTRTGCDQQNAVDCK